MNETHGAFIVSWDFSNGEDESILIVGKMIKVGEVKVVNAFQGQEAIDIYKKLSTVQKKED